MSLVITVCVLQMYHADPKTPVPNWITVMVDYMARATQQKTRLHKFKMTMTSITYKPDKPQINGPVISVSKNEMFTEKGYVYDRQSDATENGKPGGMEFDSMITILREILLALKKPVGEGVSKTDNQIAWQTASEIIDNFFVVIFFTTIIVVNILMLVVMPNVQQFF